MLEVAVAILLIMTLSYIIEKKFNIALVLPLIVFAYGVKYAFPEAINIKDTDFDHILMLLLPIILLPDILTVPFDKIKQNWKPILFFSVVSVVISMVVGAYIANTFMFTYLTFGACIILFAILSATDAVSVLNVFSKFNIPKQLKIIAEGDSLGNDPIALILFKLIGLSMIAGMGLGINTFVDASHVLLYSVLIGISLGYIGFYTLKYLDDTVFELIILYLTSISAFLFAEHFHASGILATIISIMYLKYMIDKNIESYENRIGGIDEVEAHTNIIKKIRDKLSTTKERLDENIRITNLFALFGNSMIFIFMAFVMDLSVLMKYSYEIIMVFLFMTLIRYILSNIAMVSMSKPHSWSVVLTLAGIKGGLSLIMVHSIPDSFIYKELFVAIVVGNIILSTFINTVALTIYLKYKKLEN